MLAQHSLCVCSVCACVCVSVYALSGVTPLSHVSEKKHVEVKQCSTALFLRLKVNGVHLNPVWSFSMSSLVACIFLKTNKTKKNILFFFSLFILSVLKLSFPLRADEGLIFLCLVPLVRLGSLSYSSSSVGRSSSRSRSSLGNGRLCVTPARRETGRLSSSSSVGSSFTCTWWLEDREQAAVSRVRG